MKKEELDENKVLDVNKFNTIFNEALQIEV